MNLSAKIVLIPALALILTACLHDLEPDPPTPIAGGSGDDITSGSSSGNRGTCATSNVCVYYFDMTSSKYDSIKNACATATGWEDNVNSCESKIGSTRTQVCQQTASDSKANTYTYGLSQSSAIDLQESCKSLGGSSNIFNF